MKLRLLLVTAVVAVMTVGVLNREAEPAPDDSSLSFQMYDPLKNWRTMEGSKEKK